MFSLSHFDKSKEASLNERLLKSWGKENFTPGLQRVEKFIELNQVKTSVKIITVAGTNGKGETSRAITAYLESEKKKVALWTSPHLLSLTERFYAEGSLISYAQLEEVINQVSLFEEKNRITLSYYELLFCAFILWANTKDLDFIVLEVGLGGRLDAVNALSCDFALITSIARDHQEILGKTYKKILFEKFGICRKKTTLFTSFSLSYLNQEVNKLSMNVGTKLIQFDFDSSKDFESHNRNFALDVVEKVLGVLLDKEKLKKKSLHPIIGTHEIGGKSFSFYGSHNPEALRKLVHFLSSSPYNKKSAYDLILFSLSKRSVEDSRVVIDLLRQIPARRKVFVPMHHHKAQALGEIEFILKSSGIEILTELSDHFIHEGHDLSRILVTGSNYFIGEFYGRFCLSGK